MAGWPRFVRWGVFSERRPKSEAPAFGAGSKTGAVPRRSDHFTRREIYRFGRPGPSQALDCGGSTPPFVSRVLADGHQGFASICSDCKRSLKPQSTGQAPWRTPPIPSLGIRFKREGSRPKGMSSIGSAKGGTFPTFVIPSYDGRPCSTHMLLEKPEFALANATSDKKPLTFRQRLADHNSKKCPHTSKFVPLEVKGLMFAPSKTP